MPLLPSGHRIPPNLAETAWKLKSGKKLGFWDIMETMDPGGIMGTSGAVVSVPSWAKPYMLSLGYRYPRLYKYLMNPKSPLVKLSEEALGGPAAYAPESKEIIFDPFYLDFLRKWSKPSTVEGLTGKAAAHETFHHIAWSSEKIRNSIKRFMRKISENQFDEITNALADFGYDTGPMELDEIGHEFFAKSIDQPEMIKKFLKDEKLKQLVDKMYEVVTRNQ